MKRRLLNSTMILVFLLSITLLSGCSKKSNSASASVAKGESVIINPTDTATLPNSEVTVFIASSLSNAMTEIRALYKTIQPNVTIIYNADSSGTLQTQIEEGAECDMFFSAAIKQVNNLDDNGYIVHDSVLNLLENTVVLIKPTGATTKVTSFETIYKAKNIALAGEDVPVGAYAREIFSNLGIWDRVKSMEINEGANVSVVLAAVSEASNEVGVVYATDAESVKDSVEIICEAPESSLSSPVTYPVCLVNNEESDETQKIATENFLTYLSSPDALDIFEKYGFTISSK